MFTGVLPFLCRAGCAALLLARACADDADLVEIRTINPHIRVELPYATTQNFTGVAVYSSTRCYLRRGVAQKLSAAQAVLEKKGFGLKVWDGYRPLSVQKKFWALVPDDRYVASPAKGSRHNRGAAVDVTLVDKDGREVEMPTKFDDFSERAAAAAPNHSPTALANRAILQEAMTGNGFKIFPSEWWHFDAEGWEKYPLLDLDPAAVPVLVNPPTAKPHE